MVITSSPALYHACDFFQALDKTLAINDNLVLSLPSDLIRSALKKGAGSPIIKAGLLLKLFPPFVHALLARSNGSIFSFTHFWILSLSLRRGFPYKETVLCSILFFFHRNKKRNLPRGVFNVYTNVLDSVNCVSKSVGNKPTIMESLLGAII